MIPDYSTDHILLFVYKLPLLQLHHQTPCSFKCGRQTPRANSNINKVSDPAREDEIAAKIAKLRKLRNVKPQTPAGDQNVDETKSSSAEKAPAKVPYSFRDLPDWKKEQVLNRQIEEAENFFNKPSSSANTTPKDAPKNNSTEANEDYKPKVSTWGVFPRPENISKTYGGGRRIDPGSKKDNEESKAYDEKIKKKLDDYNTSLGIDVNNEEEHREEIDKAIVEYEKMMRDSMPGNAVLALEGVTQFLSDRSRLGGQVFLALALAYEGVGRREDARKLYVRLRKSAFPDTSAKARQLLQGFDAMQILGVEDKSSKDGYQVMNFSLPDLSRGIDKRYETSISGDGEFEKSEEIGTGTNLALVALMLSPVVVLMLLVLLRR